MPIESTPSLPKTTAPHPYGFVAALLLAILISFAGVLRAGFIDFDDDVYVTLNPHVWTGLSAKNVSWALRNVEGANWMPLTWITLQLDGSLASDHGGSPADFATPGLYRKPMRATVYHLQNLLWHAGAAVILFALLCRMIKKPWAAFAGALLWAVHPLRVESVAWVAERKDVLAMFWGLLGVYAYLRWAESAPKPRWYAAVCVCFVLSLSGKALFVTLPGLLLLLDYWPLGRCRSGRELLQRIGEKWLLVGIAGAVGIVTLIAQSSQGAVKSFDQFDLNSRLANALVSVMRYGVMQVDFRRLSLFYPFHGTPAIVQVIGAALAILAVSLLALRQRHAHAWLLVGWGWYLVAFLPLVGIIQIGEQSHADRYTYLPAVGLVIMLSGALARAPRGASMAACVVAAVCAGFTMHQVSYWRDSRTLFLRSIAVTEGNYFLRYNLSVAALREGDLVVAEKALQEAIAIRPRFAKAQAGLGFLYLQQKRFEDALAPLARATELFPGNPEFHNMHGFALVQLYRYAEAERAFEAAVQADPRDAKARENLAILREQLHAPSQTVPATRP